MVAPFCYKGTKTDLLVNESKHYDPLPLPTTKTGKGKEKGVKDEFCLKVRERQRALNHLIENVQNRCYMKYGGLGLEKNVNVQYGWKKRQLHAITYKSNWRMRTHYRVRGVH